jgi:LmbE family N-acetylglucosaminyl deacetylase
MKILIIAPHPDDEVLGCGGTIKRYSKEGNDVFLCIVTKAYTPDWTEDYIKARNSEIIHSSKTLGIKKTFLLDFPTVKLDTVPQKELNDKIAEIINKINPDILLIPSGSDLNRDHRLVFEASLVSARPIGNKIKKISIYEVLSETEWGFKPFAPTEYINISGTIKYKLKAMSCYKSELRKYPHPRSLKGITILAEKRGMESGLSAAEAFITIREIK